MKIYLAAQYHTKEDIATKAKQLEALGHTITSTWVYEPEPPNVQLSDVTEDRLRSIALRDLDEIDAADIVICFTVDPSTLTRRGGRHVEFGYALAKGKTCAVVGPRENIFHYLPKVAQVDTWDKALYRLSVSSFIDYYEGAGEEWFKKLTQQGKPQASPAQN